MILCQSYPKKSGGGHFQVQADITKIYDKSLNCGQGQVKS